MAAQISTKLYLKSFVLFMCQLVLTNGHSQTLPITNTCESSKSPDFAYNSKSLHCNITDTNNNHCDTFAILRRKSKYFSSLSDLSFLIGVDLLTIAKVNGFSAKTKSLPKHRSILVPIVCDCDHGSGLFRSRLFAKRAVKKGDQISFSWFVEAFQGLTTCEALRDENPNAKLGDQVITSLAIPIPCGCSKSGLFLSYPVTQGDTISNLATKFNTSREAIISSNNVSPFEALKPFTSLLVPVVSAVPAAIGNRSKMRRIGPYIATIIAISIGISIAIAAAFLILRNKKKKKKTATMKMMMKNNGNVDLEIQRLGLSVRTTSDKKVSFEGSNQDALEGSSVGTGTIVTPRKKPAAAAMESFTLEEMSKATEDFSPSNHIEGSVYHGRLNGVDLAIKRVTQETLSGLDLGAVLSDGAEHPNIMRLIGTCQSENEDSFLVLEYAKNGSLRDWLRGGLAIKSHFIASCYCFLNWRQRVRICLDVAAALQHIHAAAATMRTEFRRVRGDIESKNIFLDEDFNAKVAIFGFEKTVDESSEIARSRDIFGFGVVVLEVLSGQAPKTRPNEKVKIVLESESSDEMREWLDSALGEKYCLEEAVELANLARLCTEEDESSRPTADEIVERLTRLVERGRFGECGLVSESSSNPLPLVVEQV